MSRPPNASGDSSRELKAVLLAYLQAASFPPWPGADGLHVDDVLSLYRTASDQRRVPGLAELRERHPEFGELLLRFLAPNEGTEDRRLGSQGPSE